MKRGTLLIFPGIAVIVFGLICLIFGAGENTNVLPGDIGSISDKVAVTNFEECASAGNAVMQSDPRKCRDSEGNLFVEHLGEVAEQGDLRIYNIVPGQKVDTQPLVIIGEAKNDWYVDGQEIELKVVDSSGNIVSEVMGTAQDGSEFEGYKTFGAATFLDLSNQEGKIIIKSASSGKEEAIPIKF